MAMEKVHTAKCKSILYANSQLGFFNILLLISVTVGQQIAIEAARRAHRARMAEKAKIDRLLRRGSVRKALEIQQQLNKPRKIRVQPLRAVKSEKTICYKYKPKK